MTRPPFCLGDTMKRMQSPTPNRKGVHEIHSVPSRKAAALAARGWVEVADAENAAPEPKQAAQPAADDKAAQRGPLTERLRERPQFDLSGKWLSVRSRVKDELNLSELPSSKDEARVMLEDAGYEVVQ